MTDNHPPLPPFTRESAIQKIRGAENGWNTCNPELVSLFPSSSHLVFRRYRISVVDLLSAQIDSRCEF
jgi:nuclear transport factor 2 (NTF2) superfamily protein